MLCSGALEFAWVRDPLWAGNVSRASVSTFRRVSLLPDAALKRHLSLAPGSGGTSLPGHIDLPSTIISMELEPCVSWVSLIVSPGTYLSPYTWSDQSGVSRMGRRFVRFMRQMAVLRLSHEWKRDVQSTWRVQIREDSSGLALDATLQTYWNWVWRQYWYWNDDWSLGMAKL
jgi:hypothetical protein